MATILVLVISVVLALMVSYGVWLAGQLGARRRRVIDPKDDYMGRQIGG